MRYRRLRRNEAIRNLVRENTVLKKDLIMPLFVVEGKGVKKEISSMPGQYHFSVDTLLEEVAELKGLGLEAILLFGVPEEKDEVGSSAYCPDNLVARAIEEVKRKFPDMYVIADVCLCEYTSHGHCGIVERDSGTVDNDKTLPLLAKAAVSYAQAGADMIAPSDMMDGRVEYIRKELDQNGWMQVPIMAYSAKYCSSFYGPFREAADSAPQFGDRKGYQMDPANGREALKEVMSDIKEGADIVMVKPAMPYLDVLYQVKQMVNVPVCAYQVSGEYAMICSAAKLGWLDREKAAMESLVSIKRAGADMIITYFAKDFACNFS